MARRADTDDVDRAQLTRYLVAHYRAGHSLTELAGATGRSFGHVRRLLLDAGVAMRPRGGRRMAAPARPV